MGKFMVALSELRQWFDRQKRSLPWREDPSLYRVWVSEIMLQQTQVATVKPYFERFMQRFPSVESLAMAPLEQVLLHWAGLGYYSRARNLHKGAMKLAGQPLPSSREDWLQVPGVGPYTAGAIVSIALDQPEPILDGNVERVLSRIRCVDRKKGDQPFKDRLWRLAGVFVKRAYLHGIRPSTLNQALMELGATVCHPRSPKCEICPLKGICRASKRNVSELYPPKKAKKKWIQVNETLRCIVRHKDQGPWVLMRLRSSSEWRSGLWDFVDEPNDSKPNLSLDFHPELEFETQHVVTRHKIRRKTQVFVLRSSQKVDPRSSTASLSLVSTQALDSKTKRSRPRLTVSRDVGHGMGPGLDRGLQMQGSTKEDLRVGFQKDFFPEDIEEFKEFKKFKDMKVMNEFHSTHAPIKVRDPNEHLNQDLSLLGLTGTGYRWVSLNSPSVPLGSAAKKTLQIVRDWTQGGAQ